MDRQLKERLVGAAVLLATAVILIPEMLSGSASKKDQAPNSTSGDTTVSSGDGAKLKTYTIDLSKPAASTPAITVPQVTSEPQSGKTIKVESVVTTPAPHAEESPTTAAGKSPKSEPARPPTDSASMRATMVEKDDGKRSGPSASAIERAERVAPTPGGWTVQVGSFGVRATSDRLAADLKREGFTAFIVAFQSSGNTLYRVRVGPARDRATAEVLLRRVKALHPAATLVAPS